MLLFEKSALVTGAANRLGAQIARTLHENGANLIIHYRGSQAAARALVDELNQARPQSATAIAADLARDADIDRLAQQACDAFGGLSLLVNNASSYFPTRFGEIDHRGRNLAAVDDLDPGGAHLVESPPRVSGLEVDAAAAVFDDPGAKAELDRVEM